MDKIHIRGLRVFAYHGVNAEEKEKGQPFELDVTLAADLSRAGQSDDLSDTVNYAKAAKLIVRVANADMPPIFFCLVPRDRQYPRRTSYHTLFQCIFSILLPDRKFQKKVHFS